MKLKRITDSHIPEARKLITLHSETFPQYERFRNSSLLANLIDNAAAMRFDAVYEKDLLAGFFMYWDLEDCYYIHFIAVFPEMRNNRIGQQILDWVSQNLHNPVFLESEVPYNEITARRLHFYERNGFMKLANDPEILSEDRRGGHALWFMGTQPVDHLEPYLKKIKTLVYHATGE